MIKYYFKEDKMLRLFIRLILLISIISVSSAKEIDLKYVQKRAQETSPLKKQSSLFIKLNDLEKSNNSTAYYPQFSFDVQGTYQSDVFALPFKIPTMSVPAIPKDQYKALFNINQLVWDGGAVSANLSRSDMDLAVNNQLTEVNLFKIKETLNQIYFNILFLQDNLKTLNSALALLDSNRSMIESAVKNGVMLKSNLESINIEIIKTKQKISEINSDKQSLIRMLSLWIDEDLPKDVILSTPQSETITEETANRPEFRFYDLRQKQAESGKDLISSTLNPKFMLFGQGGYGAPNQLNMFETTGSFYYIVGVKMQWMPFDWFNGSRKKESIDINKTMINIEKDNFDKTLKISLVKDKEDIDKYSALIVSDEEILNRQKNIVAEYYSRLKNNTITITDYLYQVNQQTLYDISLNVHKLQKINSVISLLTKSGNY